MTTASKLDPWKSGDPLRADHLDQPRKAIEKFLQGGGFTPQAKHGSGPTVARFKIESVSGDYVSCYRMDGLENESDSTIKIAKPYLLRNSITSRGGITYTYSAVDTREADDGSDTEDQVVVPSYIAGDQIYARRLPQGGTGVEDAPLWADVNDDARAWAKQA